MSEWPTGTVTFLFTDLVGSTRLWEDQPEAMRRALARHDEILRGAVEGQGGHVVKTTGDGVHAVFASVADALETAAAGQRELGAEVWGTTAPLRVRMGIHTGAAEFRDGDYFGAPLNRAARLMAAGHGGQVLVSQASELLVRDQLPAASELVDLGEHRLRDLSRPERVFQLGGTGLVAEFPALRSLDVFLGNLPVQLTSFIGREAALKAVTDLAREHRLVTVTGVGGVGKTRLVIQAGADLVTDFADGVWLCELAAATDAEGLAEVVAAALDVPQRPGLSSEQSAVEFLRAKHALVLLDNCEHLLDEAAHFAELVLRDCADVHVLATSREVLSVGGERVYGLRSIGTGDAVQLFLDRAEAVRPDLELHGTVQVAVGEICERLDGIPLAIELAAARIVSMSPTEIAGLLDERFRLLSGGRRGGVERHQTLRATVEWSYSLLDDVERLVFDRLSVFPGSFESQAATAVAGHGLGAWEVIEALASLVRKSMLYTDGQSLGATRYGMLETLRQYGREQLRGRDDIEAIRRRHAGYYADLAERFGPQLMTDQELEASAIAIGELDNLRAAVSWALDADSTQDVQLGLRIIAWLGIFVTTARFSGIGVWAERATARLNGVPLELRAAVLGTAAFGALNRGDPEAAERFGGAAVADGVPPTCQQPALAWAGRAMVVALRDFAQGGEMLRQAAAELQALGNAWGALNLSLIVVIFAALIDDTERAREEIEPLLARARQLGNPSNLVIALYAYAWAWWRTRPEEAQAALEESITLTEQGASDVVYADVLELLAQIRHVLGDTRGGLEAVLAGQAHADRVGNRPTALGIIWFAANLLAASGAYDLVATVAGITDQGPLAAIAHVTGDPAGQTNLEHQQALEAARVALGDDAYQRLADRGAEMSYEQMIEWAQQAIREHIAAQASVVTADGTSGS